VLDFSKDIAATKARKFNHRHSYVNIAGHQYLRGKDKDALAEKVYADAKGLCCVCGCWRDRSKVDLEHENGGSKHRRCDCYHTMLADGTLHTNVRIICTMDPAKGIQSRCHIDKHGREPRWSKKERAA